MIGKLRKIRVTVLTDMIMMKWRIRNREVRTWLTK